MNSLITVKEFMGKEVVDARELHTALEVARDFSTWIKDRIEKYGFIQGKDYQLTKSGEVVERAQGGGTARDRYDLSVAMAKELATVENNDRGREVRRYLIAVEEAWNTPEYVMLRALKYAQAAIEESKKTIALLQPKAAFFDQVADTKDALDMRSASATLNIEGLGRNNLYEFLRSEKVLDSRNLPYRKFQDAGWFRVIETSYVDTYGEVHINLKTLVYQRGLDAIRRMWEGNK